MPADPEMWSAFIRHLEGMIAERKSQITPLRDGKLRTGSRSPETNGQWVDTTDANIRRLESEMAELQSTIDRVKNEHEGS